MSSDADLMVLDTLLRGAGAGIALLLCAKFMARGLTNSLNRYGMLFGLGAASYLFCSGPWFMALPIAIHAPILLLCIFNPLFFWLFARALFDDEFRLAAFEATVISVFTVLVVFRLGARAWLADWVETLSAVSIQVGALVLILYILFTVLSGLGGDLLERRRQLRIYVVLITGAYMFLIVVAELALAGAPPPVGLMVLNALGILLLIAGISFVATELNGELFPAEEMAADSSAQRQPLQSFDADLMERAVTAMEAGAYHDEKLTLAALAETLHAPEYRLRQAINQGLGYRNFNAFLNTYRLAEIRTALNDPQKARLPILTIALGAGYNSIAPFNRAFKAEFGLTPSAFRRAELGENGENSADSD